MRVLKSQCSIFKDLYRGFLKDEVDEEAKAWMQQHMKECTYCREWGKSVDEGREDVQKAPTEVEKNFDETKATINKVRIVLAASMVLIIFTAVWMSDLFKI